MDIQSSESFLIAWSIDLLPEPLQPIFAEGTVKSADFLMPDAEKDADPLAGWEDKQDRHVSYDPHEGILETGDISGRDEEFITEGEHGSKENISDNDETGHTPEIITAYGNGLIPIAEIREAREITPIFRWRSRTGSGEACEIAGHDFSDIYKPGYFERLFSCATGVNTG